MGEADGGGGAGGLGLVLGQPGPLGGGEGGAGDAADPVGPDLRTAEFRHQAARLRGRAHVVPEQRRADGEPSASSVTRPCCWPPTETAAAWRAAGPQARTASVSADHQSRGSLSRPAPVVTRCGAWPVATIRPVPTSTTRALADWVELSIPTTSGPSAVDIGLSVSAGGPSRAGGAWTAVSWVVGRACHARPPRVDRPGPFPSRPGASNLSTPRTNTFQGAAP